MISKLFENHLPQALLLLGTDDSKLLELADALVTHVLCTRASLKSCGHCRACLFMKQKNHPDVLWIQPEKAGSAIKIDQIRGLNAQIYQTPQCATQTIVLIAP